MRVFAKKTLRAFWKQHNDAEQSLKAWHAEALKANWQTPHDVKADFPTAKILTDNRVVFKIRGNQYRLIVKMNYEKRWVFNRFIGTHEEYDQIDATTV